MNADTNQDAYLNQIMMKIPKPQSVKQNMLPRKKQFVLKSDKIILISDHYGMPVYVKGNIINQLTCKMGAGGHKVCMKYY